MLDGRAFLRRGAGIVAALVLVSTMATCGGDGGPTDPDGGDGGDAGPTLVNMAPTSGDTGNTANVVGVSLSGTGFDAGNLRVLVSGSGVDVTNVSIISATALTADFIISGGAATGDRSVVVSTDAGTSESRTFTITRSAEDQGPIIEMSDEGTSPLRLDAEVGEAVTWVNVGSVDHTVSPYGHEKWEGVLLEADEVFRHTFDETGEFSFFCLVHSVEGFITVVDPS